MCTRNHWLLWNEKLMMNYVSKIFSESSSSYGDKTMYRIEFSRPTTCIMQVAQSFICTYTWFMINDSLYYLPQNNFPCRLRLRLTIPCTVAAAEWATCLWTMASQSQQSVLSIYFGGLNKELNESNGDKKISARRAASRHSTK